MKLWIEKTHIFLPASVFWKPCLTVNQMRQQKYKCTWEIVKTISLYKAVSNSNQTYILLTNKSRIFQLYFFIDWLLCFQQAVLNVWIGVKNIVFCSGYHAPTRFWNLQRWSITFKEHGTLQKLYTIWFTVRLSVL